MNKNNSIKTLLIDDHPVVLNGLKGILDNAEGVEIGHIANNGAEALSILENNKIDLIISDISMPVLNGIELTTLLKKKYPAIKIILLTAYYDEEILKDAAESGAEACLLKDITTKKLLEAIYRVTQNGYNHSGNLLKIASNKTKESVTYLKEKASFSLRELEILELLIKGYPNKKVADQLKISYHTVTSHRRNIMKRTDSHNIQELIIFAKMNNLIPDG